MMTKISSSLKKRLITAAILAPIVLAVTYWAPSDIFALLLLLFLVLSAYEWVRLAGIVNKPIMLIFVALLACAFLYLHQYHLFSDIKWLLYFAVAWWLYIVAMLACCSLKESTGPDYYKLIQGVLTILPAVLAMFFLHQQYGPLMVFYLFAIIWGADVGAYFSGKRFGKRKLAPVLSPGKTIEGVMGGLLLIVLLALVVANYLYSDISDKVIFIVISVVVTCISIVGDLYESLLKREAGVKDSSQLLPGHGGVLDRIDSLLAAAPVFLVLYNVAF